MVRITEMHLVDVPPGLHSSYEDAHQEGEM
jgi:hypothetical protein